MGLFVQHIMKRKNDDNKYKKGHLHGPYVLEQAWHEAPHL
jgi:hypothetical protein